MMRHRLILGVDPGARTGLALYDNRTQRVVWSATLQPCEALEVLRSGQHQGHHWSLVGIERLTSTGRANSDILRAAEDSGRMYEAASRPMAPDMLQPMVVWRTRREVCRHWQVSGAGKDGQIIDRLCEAHGLSRREAKGRKACPGPFFGVSGDAWQALGVAVMLAESLSDEQL